MRTENQETALTWIKTGIESGSIALKGMTHGGLAVNNGKDDAEYLATLFKEITAKLDAG